MTHDDNGKGLSVSGKMTRMEVKGGSSFEIGSVGDSQQSFGWRAHQFCSSERIVSLVLLATALVCLIILGIKGPGMFSVPSTNPSEALVLGSDLRYLVHRTFIRAEKEGSLVQGNITRPSVVECGGIEFVTMVLLDQTFKSRSNLAADPFDHNQIPTSHIVAPISPKHTLILNKFYTIKEHAILVTNTYEDQETLLSIEDFEAWQFCISSVKALGFYNSNAIAGASQRHKHMQFIPLDEIMKLRASATYALPIDSVIRPRIIRKEWRYFLPFKSSGDWMKKDVNRIYEDSADSSDPFEGASLQNIYSLPEYHFKHSIAALISFEDWSEISGKYSYSEYLYATYRELLLHIELVKNIGTRVHVAEGAYNLLLTEKWMMVVSRQQESYFFDNFDPSSGVVANVNGMAFAGLLLARSPDAMKVVLDMSPISILQGVSSIDE